MKKKKKNAARITKGLGVWISRKASSHVKPRSSPQPSAWLFVSAFALLSPRQSKQFKLGSAFPGVTILIGQPVPALTSLSSIGSQRPFGGFVHVKAKKRKHWWVTHPIAPAELGETRLFQSSLAWGSCLLCSGSQACEIDFWEIDNSVGKGGGGSWEGKGE